MDTRESIEKAVEEFCNRIPANQERPHFNTDFVNFKKALAEHLDKALPVTFDAVWQAVTYFGDCQNLDAYLRCNYNGSGSVISSRGTMFSWSASKTPGTSIIEAIKDAMPTEPTLNEKALVALNMLDEAVENIHKALEAKGCKS